MQTAGADMTPTDPNERAREQRELAKRIFEAAYPPTPRDTFASFGRRCIDEAIRALSHAAAVEGYVTVPKALTTDMLEAGEQELAMGNDFADAWEAAIDTMLGVPSFTSPPAPAAVAGGDAEEDAYVIDRLAHLLAEISVIVNGPEPAGTKWSYHDLPEKVEALVLAPQAPPAAEPVYPSAFNMGIARAGDWVIELSVGCNRVCDERYAAGWNACREKALEATGAAFAARYRWLRDQGGCPFAETDAAWDDPNALDEAIDKARGAI